MWCKKGRDAVAEIFSRAHIRESPNAVVTQPLFATGAKFQYIPNQDGQKTVLSKASQGVCYKRLFYRRNFQHFVYFLLMAVF